MFINANPFVTATESYSMPFFLQPESHFIAEEISDNTFVTLSALVKNEVSFYKAAIGYDVWFVVAGRAIAECVQIPFSKLVSFHLNGRKYTSRCFRSSSLISM